MDVLIRDETAPLQAVILGTAEHFGGTPAEAEAYDPKSREHIRMGTYPVEADLTAELEGFADILRKYSVQVYRPEVLEDVHQVFARDIGFVIEDKFIIPQILWHRRKEIDGIDYILDQIRDEHLVEVPDGIRIEGGDIMPWNNDIFIGYSRYPDFNTYQVARTNEEGVQFIRDLFPGKQVHAFELKKSDTDPRENALHLDCCFQPIGKDKAIIYPGGFKNEADYRYLVEYFGEENVIVITREEMYEMNSNVFSISPEVIVSERGFHRLNSLLREMGFTVEEVKFSETSKMEGLLRCVTLPLIREYAKN